MKSAFKFSPQAWGELEGGILMDLRQSPPNFPKAWGRNKRILQEALLQGNIDCVFHRYHVARLRIEWERGLRQD